MAPRKDQMRIIRQDAGFSAKLGFGGPAAHGAGVGGAGRTPSVSADAGSGTKPAPPPVETREAMVGPHGGDEQRRSGREEKTRKEEEGRRSSADLASRTAGPAPGSAARGQVVYVAVSLTARQARLAEAWAAAARCSVAFLIRRVAQSLRDQVFDDWARSGLPEVHETRGARGKHPTSVTLTLRPQFAAELAARHDPLGLLGLARVMGPAFRARFHEAFDTALAKAPLQTTPEGDDA